MPRTVNGTGQRPLVRGHQSHFQEGAFFDPFFLPPRADIVIDLIKWNCQLTQAIFLGSGSNVLRLLRAGWTRRDAEDLRKGATDPHCALFKRGRLIFGSQNPFYERRENALSYTQAHRSDPPTIETRSFFGDP